MPIHEYECPSCCHVFEQLQLSASDPVPECPKCGCAHPTKLISAGAVRAHGIPKGTGGFTPPARSCAPGGT